MLNTLLEQIEIFPIMGAPLDSTNTMKLDFSPNNARLATIDLGNTDSFNSFVFGILEQSKKTYGIGGYFEHRAIYRRSAVFTITETDFRDIHLGVDIWAESGHPVFAPLDGSIHSFQNNKGFGNYGPTIILDHQLQGVTFYSLYGHLTLSDLKNLQVGQKIKKGQLFCHLGPFPENGDWPPHLHFQLMWDIMGMVGDFPGVCSQSDKDKFQKICPDPNVLIGFE